jgi:hypothetical protein
MKTKLKNITKRYSLLLYLLLIVLGYGCKKSVEVIGPPTSLNADNIYTSDKTAISVLNGIYVQESNSFNGFSKIGDVPVFTGLTGDELSLWTGSVSATPLAYYKNNLSANVSGYEFWVAAYSSIFVCNSAIEGLSSPSSSVLTPTVRQQLIGEAKFMRAYYYFYLVNLYGNAPLIITTDYKANVALPRASVDQVYSQIKKDLTDAQALLSTNYLSGTLLSTSTDRVRPTKSVASALMSRVFLFTKDWQSAETSATSLISNGSYRLTGVDTVFKISSQEAIWQLQPVGGLPVINTPEGPGFIIPTTGLSGSNPYYLNNSLVTSFEAGDLRFSHWVGLYADNSTTPVTKYYYPFKYRAVPGATTVTEYRVMFRLAEQYLIRAEARSQLGNITGALSDLNKIRSRAGLPNYGGPIDQASVLAAILHERQIELFTEGYRWLDLKRTKTVDAVMTSAALQKGTTWNTNQQLFPIFLNDIQSDPNLSQNPGY